MNIRLNQMKHDQPSQRHQQLLRGPAALFIKLLVLAALTSCAKGPIVKSEPKTPIAQSSAKDRQERLKEDARVLDLDYQAYERALAKGDLANAEIALKRLLNRSPQNTKALEGLKRIESMRSHEELITQAEALNKQKDVEGAKAKLRTVLAEDPDNNRARKLMTQIDTSMSAGTLEALLSPSFRKPISIDFQDANLKQIFTVIGQTAGLNFIFDKDVKLDQKTTIVLKNSTVEAAIYSMLTVNQLEQQIMDAKTVLVYPNNPAKVKEYQQTVVKSFMLTNARAKGVADSLKTILKSREVVVDEKLNMLIVRDSPEAIRLIEKIIALQDFAEPEVVLELEVLEVSRDRMMELGISPPGSVGLTLIPNDIAVSDLTKNAIRTNTTTTMTLNASAKDSDVDILASPRVRVINREKAKILIGNKVPTYTTSSTVLNGAQVNSPVVTYLDVGLKLEVEPTIFLNNEISIKVGLEVSNIVKSEKITGTETTIFTVGNRNASTVLRLKDGENQILAGLINSETDRALNKLPGLGDTPLLGRLFGSQANNEKKTEILLSITPRLVRNLQRQEASINEFLGGTDSSLRLRPDFRVGALEEVLANPAINREPVPPPPPPVIVAPVIAPPAPQPAPPPAVAPPVAPPNPPAAQAIRPAPAPALPPVIQLTDTPSPAQPKSVQAKPDPKARAEELRLKQAAAAEEKKQLQEQKRAAAAKAREEKLLEKKKSVDKDKASPETRQFIDNLLKQNEAP